MYLVRDDKRSGGEINSPFFKTRKGLVVNTSKKTYPSAHVITMISRAGLFAYMAFLLVLIGFPTWIPLSIGAVVLSSVLLAVNIAGMMSSKKAEKAFESLRDGLLDTGFYPPHLYLCIHRYAKALDHAYNNITVTRNSGVEDVEGLEKEAKKAQAEFWTFVNTLRANVVLRSTKRQHGREVLYGNSFKDYLAPVEDRPWDNFRVPSEESAE